MTQHITPFVDYANVAAAADWLGRAFGFVEVLRVVEDDGHVSHAEISLGDDANVLLGGPRGFSDPDGFPYAAVVCRVDDVDAHFAGSVAAGAVIDREVVDEPWGTRMYRCTDPFGHKWMFFTPVREVAPEEWGAVSAAR